MAGLKEIIHKYKYPVIVLALGLMLMLIPTTEKKTAKESDEAQTLCNALSETAGVGEVQVILSENGAVVVCEGANDATVRLNVIRAVSAYTGFTTDKISVLRMTEH